MFLLDSRSPSTAFQGFTMHDVSGMAAQTPHMPSAPGFAATPQLSVNNQNRYARLKNSSPADVATPVISSALLQT